MFDNLSLKLDKAFQSIKGQSKITEINVAQTMKEIRRALLDADVSFKVAKEFTNTVKEKALGADVLTALKPGQVLTKIMQEELTALMGGTTQELELNNKFNVILVAGLNGSGKTTFSGKLANYLKTKKAKNPLLIAGDTFRPAAIEQLKTLGEQIGVAVYTEDGVKDPIAIAKNGVDFAKKNGHNVVIVDTAGRLAVDEQLMTEIKEVHKSITPTETLFVVDAMTGQDAVNTAEAFHSAIAYDGVILTKLDGDTRGGAALTIRKVVDKPIKFIGTGEKMEALDVFHPNRMADRILGMGDVISLVERAQEQFDEEEAKRLSKKIAKNKFDFEDFLGQIKQIKRMGNMKDLVGMLPGASKMMKDVDIDDDAFKYIEAIIYSMTPKERQNPKLMNVSRKRRIASGSGTSIEEVNKLLKQFSDMGKMMKFMQSGAGQKMMQNFGKGGV